MRDIERVLDKIKKCFALSKSANPHEAAIALKQAYALMKAHNIDQDMEKASEISSGVNLEATKLKVLPVYLRELLVAIKHVFLVNAVIFIERGANSTFNTSIKFYGHESDILLAEYAWIALSRQLIQNRKNYLNDKTDNRMKKSTKTKRADIYALGWVNGVYEEIKDLKREMTNEEEAKHFAAIRLYIDTVNKNLLESKSRPNPATSMNDKEHDAWIRGLKDGESVTLGKGLKSSPFKNELINSSKAIN